MHKIYDDKIYAWVCRACGKIDFADSKGNAAPEHVMIPMYNAFDVKLRTTEMEVAGKLSGAQKQWLDALKREGYAAIVCYGWDEAREAIEKYLKEKA